PCPSRSRAQAGGARAESRSAAPRGRSRPARHWRRRSSNAASCLHAGRAGSTRACERARRVRRRPSSRARHPIRSQTCARRARSACRSCASRRRTGSPSPCHQRRRATSSRHPCRR
ncbi:MAG: hypothetical protein ACK56F_14705, partial [bacterium]